MIDLTTPRRTSAATPLLKGVQMLRSYLVPLVVVLAFNSGDRGARALGALGAATLVVLISTIGWLRLRWWTEADQLRVRSGVLRIDDRTIPVERIQRVDRHQTLLARFFGVYELHAETAGGSGSELSLEWLSQAEAESLELWLSNRTSDASETINDAATVEAQPLAVVSFKDLVIAGATSNRIGALAVILATAFQLFDDVTGNTIERLEELFPTLVDQVATGQRAVVAVGVLIFLAILVGWAASIITTLLRFWEFTLTETNGELKRSHGLLSRFEVASPSHRVQTIRIEQPLLRRLLGYASVIAETAGSPGAADGGAGVLLPITRSDAARTLTGRVLNHDPADLVDLEHVSRLSIRRGFFRATIRLAPLIAAVWWFTDQWAIPAVAGVGVAVWYGFARFRALGYRPADDHFVTRAGVLSRRTWSVRYDKIQTVAIRRSPFQRRLGLATVNIDTAGGRSPIAVIDVPTETARHLAHTLVTRSTLGLNPDAV